MKKQIIAAVAVMALLCGCTSETTQNDSSVLTTTTVGQATSSDKPAETTARKDNSSEPEVSDEPVEMKTPGGAVIVGVIEKDGEGWFLKPEQPLDVELTYFVDNPIKFEGLQCIRLFESADDGIEKSVFEGKTVTAKGELRIYRGNFEELYFFPYEIAVGKNVSASFAAPDLEMPQSDLNKFDPSRPLPEKMQSAEKEGGYTFNPYMLSEEALECLGNGFAEFYVDFVEAYLSYETICPCPEKEYAEMLSMVIYYEFPLFSADGSYQFFEDYNSDSGEITIHYTKSKAEHDRIVSEFMDNADAYLKDVTAQQSDKEKAAAIYNALCRSVKYDYDAAETREGVDPYYAYTTKSGVCVTFATAYSQLLTRVGIDSTIASGETSDNESHAWVIAEIDGEKYFFDPTFELSVDGGEGFTYFGTTYAERLSSGVGVNGITIGRYIIETADETMLAQNKL